MVCRTGFSLVARLARAGLLSLALYGGVYGRQASLIFSEHFDTLAVPALPAGWVSTRARAPLQNDFVSTASGAQSLPNALLCTNATIAQSIATCPISFEDRQPGELSFVLRRSTSFVARIIVEASTDGGRTFDVSVGDTVRPTGETGFTVLTLPIPQILSGLRDVRFRWRTTGEASGASGTLRLDDCAVTARLMIDLAVTGIELTPRVARESTLVSSSVAIANAGLQPVSNYDVDLGSEAGLNGGPPIFERWASTHVSGILAPGESTKVVLDFVSPPAGIYDLIVSVYSSIDQFPDNNRFRVSFQSAAGRSRLVINEIMYAPTGTEPEWIELYNPRDRPLLLEGWKLGDGSAPQGRDITSNACSIPAGDYAVVTKDTAGFLDVHPDARGRTVGMAGFPSLNNGGDAVVLRDNTGMLIDSLQYIPGWGGSGGSSLERRDWEAAALDSVNWGTCVEPAGSSPGSFNSIGVLEKDLGVTFCTIRMARAGEPLIVEAGIRNEGRTPVESANLSLYSHGVTPSDSIVLLDRRNLPSPLARGDSCTMALMWQNPTGGLHRLCVQISCEGDPRARNDTLWSTVPVGYHPMSIRINEIMHTPFPGDPEYVEIVNSGEESVDVSGWAIGSQSAPGEKAHLFPFTGDSALLRPGGYRVLASDSAIVRQSSGCGSRQGHVEVIGTSSMQLRNDGGIVIVRDATGSTIDSVAYFSQWHNPSLPDCAGRSLEKVRPDLPSNDSRSWGSCVLAVGGTPGCVNSIYVERLPFHSRLSVSPNPFSPDGDGKDDHAVIHYEVPMATCTMMVKVFDVRGRLVRRLANNDPCASRGMIIWDGLTDERRRARIGIYVVMIEVLDEARNTVWTGKTAIVVAGRL